MTGFSTQQVKALKKLFARPPETRGLGNPEKFLLQFVFFEAVLRLVGHYYRERAGQKKKSTSHESLNIEVARRSFAHFGILVADLRLDLLLDSGMTTRNMKSARNLRNGLVHRWKAEDVKEVIDRYIELNKALTGVINAIKVRIEIAAE